MERPRLASTLALSFGLLFAGTLLVATSAATGCSSAQTKPAPDAALPECNHGPFYFFCQPAPAEGQAGCNTSAGTSPVLSKLPSNTTYPVGCVVNFVGSRDDQGDCRLDAVCKCVMGEVAVDAGAPEDAGTTPPPDDAGEDAEAGTPAPSPAPQPTTQQAPVWLCAQ